MAEFSQTPASVQEYGALRAVAGLGAFPDAAAHIALDNTLHGVWLREQGRLVGTGRLIGDGGCFAQVTDIAVYPDLPGQGFGSRIMDQVMTWVGANLPPECYISLIADPGAEARYEKFGFAPRTGMARRAQ